MTRPPRRLAAALLCLGFALPVAAEPPPHAKAYGLRKNGDSTYAGYAGHVWPRDFGVLAGRCNATAVLGAAGAVVGGAIGSRAGDSAIGVIVGSVIGALIGASIGRELDRHDQACIGHTLELTPTGQVVNWTNTTTNVAYTLMPVSDLDGGCRQFRLVGKRGGKEETTTQVACSSGDGRWTVR